MRFLQCSAIAVVIAIAACSNAGSDRVLSVTAAGIVEGVVYFDADGSKTLDFGDVALPGVGLRLVVAGTEDTLARATSDAAGSFRLALPVARYVLAVDKASIGDTLVVARVDTSQFEVRPMDSIGVRIAVSYPHATIAAVRALPVGVKVFVDGVALNDGTAFGDSTVHLEDLTGAIRTTRLRILGVLTGDSVRFLGTRQVKNAQPVLDNVTPIFLGVGTLTPADSLSTANAASANAGTLDAALVRIAQATIQDTATMSGDFDLTVSDGSGPLTVVLDKDAGIPFAPFVPGAVIDAAGVLVPTGLGTWVLKPRSGGDLTIR